MANHPEGDQPEYISDEVIPVEEPDLDDDGDDGDFEDPDDSETGHESDPDDEGKDHVETRATQVRRAFARRVITKYAELADPGVKPEHLELAASLMPGVRNDPAELAIAILCGVRPRTQAVSDVMGVREADAMDAGVIVASWPNAQLRKAWNWCTCSTWCQPSDPQASKARWLWPVPSTRCPRTRSTFSTKP